MSRTVQQGLNSKLGYHQRSRPNIKSKISNNSILKTLTQCLVASCVRECGQVMYYDVVGVIMEMFVGKI